MPKRIFAGPLFLVLVLLVLAPAAPASAILACSSCHCGHSCSTTCGSPGTTCGNFGVCAGGPACGGGGGCLTAGDLKSFLDSLPADTITPTAVQDRQAQVVARLTWRLAEQAELVGLGTVYGGGKTFRFQGPRGQALTADIALVSTAAAKGSRIPALVVELAGAPGFRSHADRWLRAGSSVVLVVDAVAGTVSVHHGRDEAKSLGADDLLELPDLLPGWSLRVADLFE